MKQLFFADNENFWFETLRSLGHIAYGGADLGEVLVTADRIKAGDYDSWYDEWSATAERLWQVAVEAQGGGHVVTARDTYLRASNYYRTAEFFLHGTPDDPRISSAYGKSIEAFHRFVELSGPEIERVAIPYEDTTLPGYFYRSPLPGRQPLVVMHNGFDGTAEELRFFGALAAQERGYHVLCFDGPGQPGTRHPQGLLFRPDWENVVGPVLDHALTREDVDPEKVSLYGVSLGGELCLRAAAFEPRLKAVIANDGVYDFGAFAMKFVDGDRAAVEHAVTAESAPETDAAIAAAMAANPSARWAFEHGQFVMGGSTPREFAAKTLDYHVRDGIAARVSCAVLICEAAEDLFFRGQPEQVYDALTTSDKTWLRFTEEEGADAHCHLGGQRYAFARMLDWLEDRTPVNR
ncbi:alpha/beta hydrolase family protein [Amycolatopsis jejuensis]|uniref:alpha/beta hydrolase family protein n=1 Tax=Amycolatopsis jejuensis TaxID=330084 RepID=UPI000526D153|nr:alpha/beta fold hydrolase [Amycolatopsis jejuensis]